MAKIGRNSPCHCGSGKKYKHCHLDADAALTRASRALQLASGDDPDEGQFRPFAERFPDIASNETRQLIYLERDGKIPAGTYSFVEAFCGGKRCDCRRAMFFVEHQGTGARRHVVTFGFGWEPLDWYVRWMHGDRAGAEMAKGPCVEIGGPTCAYEDELLDAFVEACIDSKEYVDRVAAHYRRFKASL